MSKKLPLVSIIIPVYKSEKYIDKCLESVLSQTYKNIEVLLMVCFPSEKAIKQCFKWKDEDHRVIIVYRRDLGLGDARNYALRMAKGKYISFVDIDDWIEHNFIEKLVIPLEKDDADLALCNVIKEDKNSFEKWIALDGESRYIDIDMELYLTVYAMVWCKIYRKSFIEKYEIRMPNGAHEDDAMHLMVAANVKRIYYLKEELYHYNISNEESLMHNVENNKEYVNSIKFALEYLEKRNLLDNNKDIVALKVMTNMYKILNKNYSIISNYFSDVSYIDKLSCIALGSFALRWQIHANVFRTTQLEKHYVFTSLIAQMQVIDKHFKSDSNEFRKKALYDDLNRGFFNHLKEKINFNTKYLFLDFMEERYDIVDIDGMYFTKTSLFDEVIKNKGIKNEEIRIIENGSEEYFSLWYKSCDKLIEIIKNKFSLDKIILVCNKYSECYEEGETKKKYCNIKQIKKMNLNIEKMEKYFISHIECKVIKVKSQMPYTPKYSKYGVHSEYSNREWMVEIQKNIRKRVRE